MRVSGGEARGVILKTGQVRGLRPTTDRVRGAIFSSLVARSVDLSQVLDLYAGSGALGIEALSRGAEWVDFVEKDPRLCHLITENLNRTGFADRAAVHVMLVERALVRLSSSYSLALMDPPYAQEVALASALSKLISSTRMRRGATIVVEHSSRLHTNGDPIGLSRIQQKVYGDTTVSMYTVQGGEA